jgi:sterol desaturase/sphingolipid hydroxylase (fatty acid hydroxylase superfamily)
MVPMLGRYAKVRSRHASDKPWPTKEHTACDFIEETAHRDGWPGPTSGQPLGRECQFRGSREMCTELFGRTLWNQTMRLVPGMTVAIYFGELAFALAGAIALLAISAVASPIGAILFCCGLLAWTLAEYLSHRFVLHAIAPVQHGIHHRRPQDAIDKVFWQIWLAFAAAYLIAGAAVLAGVLVAYAWYLFVHYCAHHNPAFLPASLLKHHLDHHRFANRNYGVTTKLWDRVFGTMLR